MEIRIVSYMLLSLILTCLLAMPARGSDSDPTLDGGGDDSPMDYDPMLDEELKPAPAAADNWESVGAARSFNQYLIDDSYPVQDIIGEVPHLIFKEGVDFNFSCSSREKWHICNWKYPHKDDPCPIVYSSLESAVTCPTETGQVAYKIRKTRRNNLYECEISGKIFHDSFLQEGNWSCHMEWFQKQTDKYFNDQKNFTISIAQEPRNKISWYPKNVDTEGLFVDETIEVTCEAEGAYPRADMFWYLNDKPLRVPSQNFKMLVQDGPRETFDGKFYVKQQIEYTASLDENGQSVRCETMQWDDHGNEIVTPARKEFSSQESLRLYVKEIPEPPPKILTAEVVGAVVSVIIILILAGLLLGFAWYTRRWCFAVPIVTRRESDKPKETGEMDIQTDIEMQDRIQGHDMNVGTETQPLLGKAIEVQADLMDAPPVIEEKDDLNMATDQMLPFMYEGEGSVANSLSSLGSGSDGLEQQHWSLFDRDKLRSMGPKYEKLADLFDEISEDEDSVDLPLDGRASLRLGGEVEV